MRQALSERLPALLPLILTTVFLCLVALPAEGAESGLARQVRTEQEKARQRRAGLARLTERERSVNAELAKAEDAILAIEAALARQEERLGGLLGADRALESRQTAVEVALGHTEAAMAEVLRTLWEIHSRRIGVEGRDLPDWPVTDREYTWSANLFASLDKHRADLAAQRKQLDDIRSERSRLAGQADKELAALNARKQDLLEKRLAHNRRLDELRKERRDAEADLARILALVDSLNIKLREEQQRGDIEKSKGSLPLPAPGAFRQRFNASANPPVRGVTIATEEGERIRAVHWGKVVHNDILRGFGRVVIIMHDEAYYSLYAFLSESDLAVGQDVARGDSVGKAGFSPAINAPGLYFELRFHQKAINPEQWFSK